MTWCRREELEDRESQTLHRWAARSAGSGGRRTPEPADPMRTEYQRDRDRLIHSTAFRRLQHKTQVLAAFEGDHYRSRMTHSLEVSQMARSSAIALRLNADLAEAVALAHDLGHPPFGHAGEEALNDLMQGHGGFLHNAQGSRIVDHLEDRHGHGHGLNLVYQTRRSLLKRAVPPDYPVSDDLRNGPPAPLEAALVDLCDRIAYLAHDLEDGMRAGAFELTDVRELRLWQLAAHSQPTSNPSQVLSWMIGMSLRDLIETSAVALETAGDQPPRLRQGDELTVLTQELQAFLRERFYRADFVLNEMAKGRQKIAEVFEKLVAAPEQMPAHSRARVDTDGLERAVCDYVAGMTDRFLLKQ